LEEDGLNPEDFEVLTQEEFQERETENQKQEKEKSLAELAGDLAETVAASPAIIARGASMNPAGVTAKAAASAVAPNAYSAFKEGRYLGMLPGIGLDAAQLLLSPFKALGLGLKTAGMSNRIINPVAKSSRLGQNIGRNFIREGATGAIDNLAYEAAADALDDRRRGAADYAASGLLGLGTGGFLAAPISTRAQIMSSNDYAKWLPESPLAYKNKVKQDIRNAQNETGSDFETFSKLVNESHPLTSTRGIQNKASKRREEIERKKNAYENSPDANAPAQNATLSDFQKMLEEKLYSDNSGNLGRAEKDLVLRNFYDDAADMLIANSPRLKSYLEQNSQQVLGNPKAYLGNKNFVDLALARYNLSPNEMNSLRKAFSDRTTLTIPSKPGYVRAGADNRNNNEYSRLFKDHIDESPETLAISEYNKRWSKAKNHEELAGKVLAAQGHGGLLGHHFPYFDMNPEINPTAIGNTALKARTNANQAGGAIIGGARAQEGEITDAKKFAEEIIEEGKRLGIKTEEDMRKFVITKLGLEGTHPKGEVFARSQQRSGEK
jgi:hypothetical protein